MKTCITIAASVLALFAGVSSWAADPEDIGRLGKDLTPAGGEVAGNKDGSIPAWEGELAPLPGWTHDHPRGEFWQYKDEKPQFSIDAGNVETYADRLTPAQIFQVKNTPGYRMDIYPTHRNCSLPEFVQQNTKTGAGRAKIAEDGWSLDDAVLPSVPFPFPQSGIEAMWNFQTRYQGIAEEWPIGRTFITAAPGTAGDNKFRWTELNYYPWAAPGQNSPKDFGGLMTGIFYPIAEPVALAGQALLTRYYFGKAPEPFYYFTGQRRVRRLPSYAYDAPIIGTENQEPQDEMEMFFGNPDRFDWKLLGKKEIYAPYNGFRMADFTAKISDVVGPRFINPEYRRYELHRLWVLEGTVKAGMRHSAPKKVLYLDEDSWNIVVGEDYDGQGKLWRLNESPVMPAWELHSCVSAPLTNLNDLISGRYVADLLILEGKDLKFYTDPSEDHRLRDDFYSGENLRLIMER
jgi:hypothetical protein